MLLFDFSPARFLELHRGVVDLASIYLFVLIGYVHPGLQAQPDVIARAEAGGRGRVVVAHTLEINEAIHAFAVSIVVKPQIYQM